MQKVIDYPKRNSLSITKFKMNARFSLFFFFIILILAFLSPWISPHDPVTHKLTQNLKAPFFMKDYLPTHYLGTDGLGRDLLSFILHGLRISLMVGIVSIAISTILGITLGLFSGYLGGRFDSFVMRIADFQLTLPTVLVALAVIAVFGSGIWKLILLIGFTHWTVYARIVRGSVLVAREKEFIEAARSIGQKSYRIIFIHILPSVINPVLIISAVELPRVMLLESTLSFLGLGVPPTVPSLGGAIAHGYEFLLSGYWWLTLFPGFALMSVVMSINMIGDWLRDYTDPRD
ncbi:MAG: ABC transporter permease [bacterium]